jgi:hypothetical protein
VRPTALGADFRTEHSVDTVTGLGWAGTKNGDLLDLAAGGGFDVLVTVDVGMRVPSDSALRVVVLRAESNRLEALRPLMPSVLERLANLPPGRIEIATFDPGT